MRKAFLLCAGAGTRLGPLTRDCPKCLLPVAGRSLLHRWLEALEGVGVEEVLINLHHHPDKIRSEIANRAGPLRIRTAYEPELLGSAGTLADNASFAAGERFLVVYSDNLTDLDLQAVERFHASRGLPMTVVLFRSPRPEACGIASLDESGRLQSFEEKPQCPRSNLACAGVFLCERETLDRIPKHRPADIGRDLMPRMVGQSAGFLWEGMLVDMGTPEGYAEAQTIGGAR